MKLVLRSDVELLGKRGDVVEVSDGYARNFLLPKGLAFQASPKAEAQAAAMRRAREVKDASLRSSAQDIASRLVPTVISITAKAGPEGRLFGSVGSTEIAEAVLSQTSIEIDRRQILVAEPIRTVGTHSVPAKLHAEVEFPITIEITAAE